MSQTQPVLNKDGFIQQCDTIDVAMTTIWISARCVLPLTDYSEVINNIKSLLPETLQKHFQLRLSIKTDKRGAKMFSYCSQESLTFDSLVIETKWPDTELVDLDNIKYKFVDSKPPYEALFKLRICQNEKNKKIALRLDIAHTLADGHSIFEILNIFAQISQGIKDDCKPVYKIHEFGHTDLYDKICLEESLKGHPKSWDEIPKGNIFKKVSTPNKMENIIYDYDMKKIRKILNKYNISVQGLMNAISSRAFRKYFNLNNKEKVGIFCPTNTRKLKWSTEINKTPFFTSSGGNFITVEGQDDLETDLKHCYLKLQNCVKSMDPIMQTLIVARFMDKDTLKYDKVDTEMPAQTTHYIITTSNIGNIQKIIKNCDDFLFLMVYKTTDESYGVGTYVYYDDNVFRVTQLFVSTFDRKYLKCIEEEFNLIMNLADKI